MRQSRPYIWFGSLFALLLYSTGADALTRCEVLEHAQRWVDKKIMYSQGPYGGYCAGNYYCDPDVGGACYRPDCSGYVSAVWRRPAPGNTTYSFAGGPWDDGSSVVISKDALAPGDALNFGGNPNSGTGHIRLFGGWVNNEKTRLWGYETSTCGTPAYRYERNWSEFGGYTPIRLKGIQECEPPVKLIPQVTGNSAITVVNWEGDQQVELWVKSTSGGLYHSWTQDGQSWAELDKAVDGAVCGSVAAFWPKKPGYPEVFVPAQNGDILHTWYNNGWQDAVSFDGQGKTQVSTVVWPDRRVEVFALGTDGAIWQKHWRTQNNEWASWGSMGGSFATGATVLVWGDGHPEMFATGTDGKAWHRWWEASEGAWSAWQATLGGDLASRPIPVRWEDGRLEVFARGNDGTLHHAYFSEGVWHPMQRLSDVPIQGEPSATLNIKGNGGPSGPQIFARNADNKLVTIMWKDGWTEFEPLLQERTLASDPFAWARNDGKVYVFAIDDGGKLIRTSRDDSGNFKPWESFDGPSLDPCVAVTDPDPDNPDPDGGSGGSAGSGATDTDGGSTGVVDSGSGDGGPSGSDYEWPDGHDPKGSSSHPTEKEVSGCACRSEAGSGAAGWRFALFLVGLIGVSRKRRRKK